MILSVHSDYFPKQHYPVDLCNGKVLYFLCGMGWILKYYSDEHQLQRVNNVNGSKLQFHKKSIPLFYLLYHLIMGMKYLVFIFSLWALTMSNILSWVLYTYTCISTVKFPNNKIQRTKIYYLFFVQTIYSRVPTIWPSVIWHPVLSDVPYRNAPFYQHSEGFNSIETALAYVQQQREVTATDALLFRCWRYLAAKKRKEAQK
jgi:hypothetical protein